MLVSRSLIWPGVKSASPILLGRPARGGGHHLHQAGGADARARVHDEAALLPDQAVDVGRVEADLLALAQHGVVEGHREALVDVDHALGALAGVDAAVPDLALAGQVGGGQQFAVAHAALVVQVGGVVPFARAFGAQRRSRWRRGARLSAGLLRGGGFSSGVSGAGPGRHGGALAELLERQQLVEAAGAGDALEQDAGLGPALFAAAGQQGAAFQ